MKERPILFSGPMVRAILAGRKTQTRRVVKLNDAGRVARGGRQWHIDDDHAALACPYGQPGDRLWVRETWARAYVHQALSEHYVYAAGDNSTDYGGPWKPSIHMPRAASRITLEVTDVRVERLQDISEADAIAEGMDPSPGLVGDDDLAVRDVIAAHDAARGTFLGMAVPVARFVLLWDSINGKQPGVTNWNANPWVWVVSFRRLEA